MRQFNFQFPNKKDKSVITLEMFYHKTDGHNLALLAVGTYENGEVAGTFSQFWTYEEMNGDNSFPTLENAFKYSRYVLRHICGEKGTTPSQRDNMVHSLLRPSNYVNIAGRRIGRQRNGPRQKRP